MVGAVALTAGFVVLLGYSCSLGPGFNYNGSWEGHRKLSASPDPYADYTKGWVTLKIADNRFEMTEKGIPLSGTVQGEGDHILLHMENVMEVPIYRAGPGARDEYPDISVAPEKNGDLLFENPRAIDGKPLELTRKK